MGWKKESGTLYTVCTIWSYYTQFVVATQKSKSKLSEAKGVRSKAAEVETRESNSVLAALTKQVAYLVATLHTKNSSSGNQRNGEG